MNKKRGVLIVLFIILLLGYLKLFYKTYSEKVVPQNADCIIAVDVKRIINTLIWNSITTPGQWKLGTVFKSRNKETDWRDMVEVPDYLFAFHAAGQPLNTWHIVLQIKDTAGFEKGLLRYHFQQVNSQEYVSEGIGIHLFRNGNELLVSTASIQNSSYAIAVAEALFSKKNYIKRATLSAITNTKSHLAIYITANKFLHEDGMVTANFDKEKIGINGIFLTNKPYDFSETDFSYNQSSLCTMGFTQPSPGVYGLLNDTFKLNISKAVRIDIDSLLLPDNKYYALEIAAIKPRTDSAITYVYDDNFNKVEKVIVNNVQEPAFNLSIGGNNISSIYNNWQRTGLLEQTGAGQLFVPMPFVKSYCLKKSDSELTVASANYQTPSLNKTIKCIFYFNVLLTKIPGNLFNYLPGELVKPLDNIESLHVVAQKNSGQVMVNVSINKKANELPLLNW